MTLFSLAVIASLVSTGGCATARLNQFRGFSQAGVAYVNASQAVTDEAGTAAISASSATLIKARPDLAEKDRRDAIVQADDDVRQRLVILHQVSSHAQLLQSYFQTLADMVDSKAPQDIGAAAQGLYNSIATIGKPLASATIGKEKVADFIPAVENIVVQNIKVKELETELRARAPAIERELATQEAILGALAKDMNDNLTITLQVQETETVIKPFASNGPLPPDWPARRDQLLVGNAAAHSAGTARNAAKALRASFVRLVAGNLSESDISSLVSEINSLLDLAGKIKGITK
jgi:hypothetical protein